MHVIYDGPGDGVRLAPVHGDVWMPRGEPVEVPDDLGERLCEQRVFTAASGRRRRRRSGTETPERPTAAETPESPTATGETPESDVGETPETPDPTMEARHGTHRTEAR